jgi:hypothetical protein
MRPMSGVSKNRHGVYYVRKEVPQPTAEFLGNGKSRQIFLKPTLDTKDLGEAVRFGNAGLCSEQGQISWPRPEQRVVEARHWHARCR